MHTNVNYIISTDAQSRYIYLAIVLSLLFLFYFSKILKPSRGYPGNYYTLKTKVILSRYRTEQSFEMLRADTEND